MITRADVQRKLTAALWPNFGKNNRMVPRKVTDAIMGMVASEQERVDRLERTIHKLCKWQGVDIGELIEEGYLEEGDL